jgi:hypothetical protein
VAAVGWRPATSPAKVTASFGGVPLGGFTVGSDWAEYVLRLPDPLPEPRVLRLDTPGWRPTQARPDSSDTRDLGVMVDRVRIAEPDAGGGASGPRAGR